MFKEMFPEKLRNARIEAGYTQQQVQDEIGIKRDTLSNYETGKREPNIETLGKLAQFYNVDTNWLLGVSIQPPLRVTRKTGPFRPIDERKAEFSSEISPDLKPRP